ncbi:MAG TPA: LytTR family DNA-binding domain-containing protein, partial [Phnomibacter sp.]|nr:LytTR family DNA-binding domain-containing protein [Phnomibacter sp.]
MIKAMIVDDKSSSVEFLRYMLQNHCPEITSVVSAISVAEALPLVEDFEPDILFLDIQMPQETGFDLLAKVKRWNFEVIFTTAYNEFAIQAIRFSALDYLLKPVDADALKNALERYKAKRVYGTHGQELYRNLIQNITATNNRPLKLALPGISDIQYVLVSEVIRLQAERNYTRLYFTKARNFLSSKTLLEYEKTLDGSGFIRVHKSHLVNTTHISGYNKQGIITMS